MKKCKNCNKEFEPPKDTLLYPRTVLCDDCFKIACKKYAKKLQSMTVEEQLKEEAKYLL